MLSDLKKRKIGPKDCMFLGYVEHSDPYRILILKSNVLDCNTTIETKNADFFEDIFPLRSCASSSTNTSFKQPIEKN